jgi:RNA polymerase sigma-70 factor (ECF subfamily)
MKAQPTCHEIEEIIDAHAAALLLFARQWDRSSAEDVVQQAFLQLVRQIKKNKTPESIPCWLYRVVRNELIRRHKSRKNSRRREEEVAAQRPEWFEPSHASRLDSQLVARHLETLPTEQREVVIARIWSGLSFEEIARAVRCSRSTAHRRYVEAIEALRMKMM